MLGAHPNGHVCLNGVLLGQATNQCLTFNAITGIYVVNDPGIIDYSIAWSALTDGVSIVFQTTVGGMATPYVEGNNSQILAIWGAQFVTVPYAEQLIPAVAGQASGLWRAQFLIGVLVDLGKPRRLGHLK